MARRKQQQKRSSKTNNNERTSKPMGSQSTSDNPTPSDESKPEEVKSTRSNDPEWYLQDANTMNAAANVPFSHPFGAPIDLVEGRGRFSSDVPSDTIPSYFSDDAATRNHSVGGVCTLRTIPCFGDNKDQNDPLNVCANALYSKVRVKNNGRKNYDPADLLMYALTFGDIYAFVIWCNRLYNYAFMYSQRNYFIGRDLINANGVNHSNLIENLANFRYWLNSYINKVSSFAVPADIYYFRRRVFMYGNFYIENGYGNIKDQLYQFAPNGFYKFAIDAKTSKGMLILEPWTHSTGALGTLDDIITLGNKLLSGISGDEDFGLMSGDILRAYEGNIIGLPPVAEEGGILPVYDPIVLSQFKNAQIVHIDWNANFNVVPDGETFRSGALMQDDHGNIISRYFVEDDQWKSQLIASSGKIISVENPTPGVGDVVEATRLQIAALGFQQLDAKPSGSERRMYVVGGSDIVIGATMLFYQADGTLYSYGVTNVVQSVDDMVTMENWIEFIMLNQFKYAPVMYIASKTETKPTTVSRFNVVSNLDNYAIIGNDQLVRIHNAAYLSLFYVPGVAKLVS